MIETKIRTIDGIEFRCQQVSAVKGYKLFAKIGKILAPMLPLLGGLDLQNMQNALRRDIATLGPGLQAMLEAMESDDRLMFELLGGTQARVTLPNGIDEMLDLANANAINTVFGGKILTLLKVMGFAVEVNFHDFFPGESRNSLSEAKAAAKNP